METELIWDENKRQANLQKHGLDFADANEVLESRYRLDIEVMRDNEFRIQSLLRPWFLGSFDGDSYPT